VLTRDLRTAVRSHDREPVAPYGLAVLEVAIVVNMHEAKSDLSRLVERALAGEEVIIARAGVPVARLAPISRSGQRRLGQWEGQLKMAEDFDAPLDESELADWEGR